MYEINRTLLTKVVIIMNQQWDRFCRQYYEWVLVRARKKITNREDAEDLVQEVFISVFRRHPDLTTITNPEAYLEKSLNNSVNSFFRKCNAKRRPIIYSLCDERLTDQIKVCSENLFEIIDQKGLMEFVEIVINKLFCKGGSRNIIRLYIKDGLTKREIAGELNIKIQTVENILNWSKPKLQKAFKSYLGKDLHDYFPDHFPDE